MPGSKFKIGQTVFVARAAALNMPGGAYIVRRVLPDRDGEAEYRIKSANESHERVVRESQLRENP